MEKSEADGLPVNAGFDEEKVDKRRIS